MTLDEVTSTAINPALALLPAAMDRPEARVMLLAIGLQESRFIYRRQISGPARGLWQFEQGGGIKGVLNHETTQTKARALCAAREVAAVPAAVYGRLEHDDVLAAGFARLLLFSDPRPLPQLGKSAEAWAYYLRNWRPGKPHPQTWSVFYAQACAAVMGSRP